MSLVTPIDTTLESRRQFLRCARGEEPCDLVLKNAQVINTFTGEIVQQDVGLCQGLIAGLGQYHGHREIDIKQRYLCPGFIEGHIHIESSMLCPDGFASAVVPRGTTAVVCDPHEIANVLGLEGILYMLGSTENLFLDIFAMIPSCVPATNMETSGATLTAKDISRLLDLSGVAGLAEMMNFPGTVYGAPDVIMKLGAAFERGMIIDGHAPGLTGKQLQAYCGAGISSDHECTTLEEAREKLRAGMYIFIREGSTAKNLEALLPLVSPATARRFLLVSDDRHPDDLLQEGHLDYILKKAVACGLDPVIALQMVTINPSERFDLKMRGAVAPGYLADLTILDDLVDFTPHQVYKKGRLVAENGQSIIFPSSHKSVKKTAAEATNTIHLNWQRLDFKIPAQKGLIRVINCVENQIVTEMSETEPTIIDGYTVADPRRDLLKISVIERHLASGDMTNGFVRGFGIKQGAIASTVAHDSHNLIIVGTDDEVMLAAAHLVADNGGGIALIHNDKSIILPLPVAGLMSTAPAEEVTARLSDMKRLAKQMGVKETNPFMLLSFLALPVIPSFKITDQGLIDVDTFQTVPLYV